MSRGFSAKARQIRSLCMQHESEVKMSRGADMTTNTHCSSRYKGELRSLYHNIASPFFYNLRKTVVQLLWIKFQFSLYVNGFTFDFPLEPPKSSFDLFSRGCYPVPLCTVQFLTKISYFSETNN